jgi:hypothetical protein
MPSRDSKLSIHLAVVRVPGWDVCFFQSCEKCVVGPVSDFFSVVNNLCHSTQEFPDRMLATFSILPSPRVSETVVEVSRVKHEMVSLADVNSF